MTEPARVQERRWDAVHPTPRPQKEFCSDCKRTLANFTLTRSHQLTLVSGFKTLEDLVVFKIHHFNGVISMKTNTIKTY